MWLCDQSEAEEDPYLHPNTFRDKGDYNKPTEGASIQPMHDLVYCSNIAALFYILLCHVRLLEVPQVQRETYLWGIHDNCNLFHLNFKGMDQHSHMEIMENTSNMSDDALERLLLRLMAVPDMLCTVQ